MQVYCGSDHGGFTLKQAILQSNLFEIQDLGTHNEQSCDYPTIAAHLCEQMQKQTSARGILICTTGVGMCITANKVKGIRAALLQDTATVIKARQHNDINVLCLPGTLSVQTALDLIKAFLETDFSGESRHTKRLQIIASLEK